MGMTSHHFDIFHWLEASHRSHLHSRGWVYTKVGHKKAGVMRGHLSPSDTVISFNEKMILSSLNSVCTFAVFKNQLIIFV